jgi:hypothetical protein
MLHEIVGLTTEPPARRRWFHDDYFDLFVWQLDSGEIIQFQLCYGIDSSEQALIWQRDSGFFHDGTEAGTKDRAAIVQQLTERFQESAHTVPKAIRRTVESCLQDYAGKAQGVPSRRREFRRAAWQKRLPSAARKAG